MTNWNLGVSEAQATHQRNIGGDEILIGGLPHHLLILFTKPPPEMNIRCEGVKLHHGEPRQKTDIGTNGRAGSSES